MTVLERLIKELTTTTTLGKKTIKKLYSQEFKECKNEEEAARKVHQRVEYLIL